MSAIRFSDLRLLMASLCGLSQQRQRHQREHANTHRDTVALQFDMNSPATILTRLSGTSCARAPNLLDAKI
jgi:hypothetical protein